jgi:hypothetical protein
VGLGEDKWVLKGRKEHVDGEQEGNKIYCKSE